MTDTILRKAIAVAGQSGPGVGEASIATIGLPLATRRRMWTVPYNSAALFSRQLLSAQGGAVRHMTQVNFRRR